MTWYENVAHHPCLDLGRPHRITDCIGKSSNIADGPLFGVTLPVPAGALLKGDRRGSNPRPSLEPQIRRCLFLGVAVRCRIGLDKPFSLRAVARSFCVLRAEWCQKWCQMVSAAPLIPKDLIAPRSRQAHPTSRYVYSYPGDAL